MQRSATRTGPGISRSPATQRRTVRASTSNCRAASTWDQPSAVMAATKASGDTAGNPHAANRARGAGLEDGFRVVSQARMSGHEISQRHAICFARGCGDDQDHVALAHGHCIGPTVLVVQEGKCALQEIEHA